MQVSLKIGSLALLLMLASCSSSSPDASGPSAKDAAAEETSPPRTGEQLVASNDCASCHATNLAGSPKGVPHYSGVYAPNITADPSTGIGGWTDAQIEAAIRDGVDDQGQPLCWVMPRFPLADADLAKIVTYLKSLPAVAQDVPESTCPAHGGAPDASAD
jgi:mono/diheme cytochrome c family protein